MNVFQCICSILLFLILWKCTVNIPLKLPIDILHWATDVKNRLISFVRAQNLDIKTATRMPSTFKCRLTIAILYKWYTAIYLIDRGWWNDKRHNTAFRLTIAKHGCRYVTKFRNMLSYQTYISPLAGLLVLFMSKARIIYTVVCLM